jgi:hypothetical protein
MKLSQTLQDLFQTKGPKVTVAEILESSRDKIFGFLLVVFSLPVALPLTPPGISIPFAVIVILIAVQRLFRSGKPTLPPKLLAAEIDLEKNRQFIDLLLRCLRFLEKFSRPRLTFLYKSILNPKISSILIILSAILMAVPFPVTNTPPGFAITLLGLGMVEEDGLFGLAGVVVFAISLLLMLVVLALIATLGWEAVGILERTIKSWI